MNGKVKKVTKFKILDREFGENPQTSSDRIAVLWVKI
jgi:hypothetical protein